MPAPGDPAAVPDAGDDGVQVTARRESGQRQVPRAVVVLRYGLPALDRIEDFPFQGGDGSR